MVVILQQFFSFYQRCLRSTSRWDDSRVYQVVKFPHKLYAINQSCCTIVEFSTMTKSNESVFVRGKLGKCEYLRWFGVSLCVHGARIAEIGRFGVVQAVSRTTAEPWLLQHFRKLVQLQFWLASGLQRKWRTKCKWLWFCNNFSVFIKGAYVRPHAGMTLELWQVNGRKLCYLRAYRIDRFKQVV